jgi:gliding motility-associated-like protein
VNSQVTSTTNQTICNNQLPYTWNGLTFTGAGSQSATLVSVAGCDSIATLNLTVNSQVMSSTDLAICNAQLPYLWNGLTFTGAGSQSATLVSAAGCDSIATLNLTVNSQVTSTTNQTICNNQLPYSWNGLTFTGAGSQSATLVSAAGCDSIATLNLTVNSQVMSSTDLAICNAQLPYSWNGLTFTGAGSQSATLVSAAGCDSIATLNLTVNAILSSTVNASTCSGEPYILPDGTPVAQAGTYPVTLSAASGCDSVVTTILQIINPVVIAFNATICQGDSYTLPWGVVVSNAGTYADTSTSVAGCDSILQVVLQVDPQMVLSLSSDTSICEGASIALTVAGANAVLWSPSSSLSDSTSFEVIASPAVNTTYTVIGNSGACSDTAQVTVTVLPLPQPVVNLSANGVCEGGAIDVSLSGVVAFQWSGYPLTCDTCAIFSFMPDTSGVLVLNATLGVCSNTFSYPITVSELVVAGISGDTTLCAGDSLHLFASGGGSYLWNTGDSLSSIHIAPQNTGYYSVVVSNGYCSDSAQVAVYVYPRPAVNAGEDTTIIFGQSAVLHGEASGALNWYPASFLSCTDCLEPIVNAPHTETYCLTTINSYGCSATDCMVLTVDTLCADLFIPNVFAPDDGGNAENNCFRLYGKDCIGTMTLTIYNRWGEKVYVSENPNDCWNGTFHDKPLNTGVFVYYLEATLITGESLSRQGNITLIR